MAGPRSWIALSALAVLAGAQVPASASAETYVFDAVSSRVHFEAHHRHFPSPVRGRFDRFEGAIEVEASGPSGPRATAVAASIDPDSVDTDNGLRDGHLRARFFETERFPEIRFRSDQPVGAEAQEMRGWLTLKGERREVTLELSTLEPLASPDGRRGLVCHAQVVLDRRDFGVVESLASGWGALLEQMQQGVDHWIDDAVTVELRIVAWAEAQDPDGRAHAPSAAQAAR